MSEKIVCSECGKEYAAGEWPWCPHGVPRGMLSAFRSYVDEYNFPEPVEITSLGQKKALERIHGLIERDRPKNGDISARIDRSMQIRKQREEACRQSR
jgi:hypothetical protein